MTRQPPTSVLAGLPAGGGRKYISRSKLPLTVRQQAVLDVAWEYLHETGNNITIRELTARLGHTSCSGTYGHVQAIEARGVYFPRAGRPVPYVPALEEESAQVERLRALYWMHRAEANTQGIDNERRVEHLTKAWVAFARLEALGAGRVPRPLGADE